MSTALEDRLKQCLDRHAADVTGGARFDDEVARRVALHRRKVRRPMALVAAISVLGGAGGVWAWRVADRSHPVISPASVSSVSVPATSAPPLTVVTVASRVPGTWRMLRESPLMPRFLVSATWTGTEALVLGRYKSFDEPLVAAAYDPSTDSWRTLAEPPRALQRRGDSAALPRASAWTGSVVLVSTAQGEVLSYDPEADRWTMRAPAPETMLATATSARGALSRSLTSWWWYDLAGDQWRAVPDPPGGADPDVLATLDDTTIAAVASAENTVATDIFDVKTLTWQRSFSSYLAGTDGPSGPSAAPCTGVGGLLVCTRDHFGLDGILIDPHAGDLGVFSLGNHSNTMGFAFDMPWFTHAWKVLEPKTRTWEDLPDLSGVTGFSGGVWTGSEILFFGGTDTESDISSPGAAAYTPLHQPPNS